MSVKLQLGGLYVVTVFCFAEVMNDFAKHRSRLNSQS